jgi:hypothetical protein
MGEYAKYNRHEVKIGTCENLYYLRHDQRWDISPMSGNVNPQSDRELPHLRFRFPFPDEDHVAPGAFEDYSRGFPISGMDISEWKHGNVQFSAHGYLVSLPCPEGYSGREFSENHAKIHRNGFAGAVSVVMQRFHDGELQTVVRCNGCGNMYRLDRTEAEIAMDRLRSEADRYLANGDETAAKTRHVIADRIGAGYVWPDKAERGEA